VLEPPDSSGAVADRVEQIPRLERTDNYRRIA